jgi:nucleoside-diphosphate-sugar epimerase
LSRIIVTGGTGFIGTNLVMRLMSHKPSSIVIISNRLDTNHKHLSDRNDLSNVALSFYTADIRDREAISDIFQKERADICIHLAAKISVADSIKYPDETLDINANGTRNVLDACHESNVKNFIFASSAAVYGDVTELPILENRTLSPLSPYGASKMMAEQHISAYQNLNKIKRAISLRIFNVYGNGQGSEGDVITQFASKLLQGMAPEVYGGGIQTRDFISVDDVVEAFISSIRLMEENINTSLDNFTSSLVFNIGTGIPTSINELAIKMIKIFGFDVKPDYKEGNNKGGILHSYADISKAREILHFNPKKGIDEGLKELVEPMLIRKQS